jgi:signal transduction histidine kinase
MNIDESAFAAGDQDQSAMSLEMSNRRHTPRGTDRRSGNIAAKENEVRNVDRDKSLKNREDNTQLREILATSREQVVSAAEALYAEADEHILVLQEANSKLVVATINATELAEKLEIAKVELEITKNLAEKANRAKSDFISSMSHELRTPLNAILGFAQLLESGSPVPTDRQAKKLTQIIKAGWYLLELINQILELAVIESGKLTVLQETVSLQEVLWECQVMVDPQLDERSINLKIETFEPTLTVIADKTRLKQVVLNLLSNAIKYNKNHGTIVVACVASNQGKISISVKDSGIGLSKEKLDQLFQPFNRLGQEKGLSQGTGIGLMISKELVELMGGTMGVKSTEGVGTEFWLELVCGATLQTSNVD